MTTENKLKVISVVGARPNFMKIAPIHRAFLKVQEKVEHIIVHTGQHYDEKMSDAFFQDLEIPYPKIFLGVGSGSHAEQTARTMLEFEKICLREKPDLIIVVGDVNSTIACALTAVKLEIKVAHVEGGLRSFDRTMPEEINRIATDSICNYCFITEDSARINLAREGFPNENIFFVGNTMIDSQFFALEKAKQTNMLNVLNLSEKEYALATIHRPSNVDNKEQFEMMLDTFEYLAKYRKIILPMHPRTRKNLTLFGLQTKCDNIKNLIITEPLGYIDFLGLMLKCDFVITDSGGIQEETTTLRIPCITLRTTTERPVTTEIGTNILVKPVKENILKSFEDIIHKPRKQGIVPDLWDGKTGDRIVAIILKIFQK